MKIIIVAGGPRNHLPSLEKWKQEAAVTWVGVDKGVSYLIREGISPSHAFGDFDSIDAEHHVLLEEHMDVHRFKPEKNETDLELALLWATKKNAEETIVLGATGGRMDHSLANLNLLALFPKVNLHMVDRQNSISLLYPGEYIIEQNLEYKYLSVLAYSEQVKGLTLKGVKYEVDDFTLLRETSRGVSNEFIEKNCTISFEEGILLLIKSKEL